MTGLMLKTWSDIQLVAALRKIGAEKDLLQQVKKIMHVLRRYVAHREQRASKVAAEE